MSEPTLPTRVMAPTTAADASPPTAATAASEGGPSRQSTASVRSPTEALHLAEIAQVRLLAGYAVALTGLVAAVLPLLGGDPLAKLIHYVGLGAAFVCAAWVHFHLRDATRYRPAIATLLGTVCALAAGSSYAYWGPYSSAVVAVPLGLYLFAAGQSFSGAWIIYLACVVPHAALAALVTTGVVRLRSLVEPIELGVVEQLAALVIAQFIFMATFLMARRVRRTTFGVLEQLERAVRSVAQREALLDEAKRDLERALRVGGPGRYTDQELGSFRLGHVLGRGAMGEVYEATHLGTGAPAAVKLLTRGAGGDPTIVARFLREAKIAASLKVANVAQVLEVPGDESGVPYLAMERLVGETLAVTLRQTPRLSVTDTLELMRQIGEGVAAAHAAGIVHRDLKPGNVFRHQPPGEPVTWKILDFGVSKLLDRGGTLTHGEIIGTPEYMAPEQARGADVDARADVHALGVIAYRALTGRPAFRGGDVPALLLSVTNDMPPCPSSITSLPPAFDAVLAVALAKEPGQRFATAGELAEALAQAASGTLPASIEARAEAVLRAHPWRRGA